MIDYYAGARYTVPLSPVPSIVKKWACDLARRFLWKERAKADSGVILAYNETVGALKDLSRGLVSLPASDAGAPPVSSGAEIAVAAVSEVFTPDVLARMPGNLGDSGSGDWESLTP